MVASVDHVSHVNGWSFHSDLPGLTRDANVDSAHLLPAAVRAGHDLSSHGSRRNTNLFAAVFWQATSGSLALLKATLQVKSSSSSSLCETCKHGGGGIENDGQRVRPCAETCLSRRSLDSYHYGKQPAQIERQRARPMAGLHLCWQQRSECRRRLDLRYRLRTRLCLPHGPIWIRTTTAWSWLYQSQWHRVASKGALAIGTVTR